MELAISFLQNPWVIMAIKIGVGLGMVMGMVPMMVWAERKVSARFQLRRGPNRVGPFGLFQLVADSLKLFWKEDFFPRNTDRLIFLAAPILAFLPGVLSFALIPIGVAGGNELLGPGGVMAVSYLSMGLLVMMAVSSVAAYGIAFAGWASNNQYSLLGGIRSSAQLISYEIVMGMAVVALLMMTGTLNLTEIVQQQAVPLVSANVLPAWLVEFLPSWNIFRQPLTFILFLVAAFAETNRAPFDLPEAEQELVGGYHTEYTGMRYAWFMNAEYAALFTMCALHHHPVPGRLDRAFLRPRFIVPSVVPHGPAQRRHLHHQGRLPGLLLHVGPLDPAAFPLGSAHEAGMERAHPPGAREHHRDRPVPGIHRIPFRVRRLI